MHEQTLESPNSPEVWLLRVLACLALLIMLQGLLIEFIEILSPDYSFSKIAALLAFGALGALIAYAAVFAHRTQASNTALLLASLGLFVLIRGSWIALFDSYQTSDFGLYYQCALEFLNNSEDLCTKQVYRTRGLFVATPALALFGPSLFAIEITNLIVATITALVVFILASKAAGPVAGFVAVLVFSVYPDSLYAMTLTSHDIHGMMWLSLFLLLCTYILDLVQTEITGYRSIARLLALSIACGIVTFLAESTRSYGVFCYAALVALATIAIATKRSWQGQNHHIRGAALSRSFVFVVPVLVSMLLGSFYGQLDPDRKHEATNARVAIVTATDTHSENKYSDLQLWSNHQFPLLPAENRTTFALVKLVNEWGKSYPTAIKYLARKNAVLSGGNGNFSFAFGESEAPEWDTSAKFVGRVNNTAWRLQDTLIRLLNVAMYLVLAARILLAPRVRFKTVEIVAWCFSAVAYVFFLLLLETQPRYDIFLLFPFAISAGSITSYFASSRSDERTSALLRPVSLQTGVITVLLTATLSLVAWLPLSVFANSRYGMVNLNDSVKMDQDFVDRTYPGRTLGEFSLETLFDKASVDISDAEVSHNRLVGINIPVSDISDRSRFVELFVNLSTGTEERPAEFDRICVHIGISTVECQQTDGKHSYFFRIDIGSTDVERNTDVSVVLFPTESPRREDPTNSRSASIQYLRIS